MLYFDVETAPYLGLVWSKWVDGPVASIERDWTMLCIAWQWDGEKKVHVQSLKGMDPFDDSPLLDTLWQLFDEADWIIAHNGNKFDIPKVQARFLLEHMPPPSPFDSIDTLTVLRKHFKGGLRSNRLDEVCQQLGLGGKVQHTGIELWKGCMAGDEKSWNIMEKYNRQDIALLRDLYYEVRPWVSSHPIMHVTGCPNCGSDHLRVVKYRRRQTLTYPQYLCNNCNSYFTGTRSISEVPKPKFKSSVRR